MQINGQTRIIPHLAQPAAYLQTPLLFNPRCAELGINAVVVPWEVGPESLTAAVTSLRTISSVAGMIVTLPHKETVAALCDRLEGAAAMMQTVNVIRREASGALVGAMFDGSGFVSGLLATGYALAGKRVLLLGAGGAASAIAYALLDAEVGHLTIANRNPTRAERLVVRLAPLFPGRSVGAGAADAHGYDLVVNGTSAGFAGNTALPLDPATLEPSVMVAEIIMKPAITPLLVAAQARGARIHTGDAMLHAQIDHFIRFVLGSEPGKPA